MATTTPPSAAQGTGSEPEVVVPQTTGTVDNWRKMRFMELGFDEIRAWFLVSATERSTAKDRKGAVHEYVHPLHADRVKRLLNGGMTHEEVIKKFA